MSFKYQFPRPAVTATITVLVDYGAKDSVGVVIGVRGPKSSAYPNTDSLPGGFLDPKITIDDVVKTVQGKDMSLREYLELYVAEEDREAEIAIHVRAGETIEQAAVRELKEELDLDVDVSELTLYWNSSKPDTDPRCHVVNGCYYVVISQDRAKKIKAGDDLAKATIAKYIKGQIPVNMAFDHANVLNKALKRYFDDKFAQEAIAFYRAHLNAGKTKTTDADIETVVDKLTKGQ